MVLGLNLNGLDFKRSLYEVNKASTCGLFLPASLRIPLGICILLLGHQPLQGLTQCKCRIIGTLLGILGSPYPRSMTDDTLPPAILGTLLVSRIA
jgi:hypothetical protein